MVTTHDDGRKGRGELLIELEQARDRLAALRQAARKFLATWESEDADSPHLANAIEGLAGALERAGRAVERTQPAEPTPPAEADQEEQPPLAQLGTDGFARRGL